MDTGVSFDEPDNFEIPTQVSRRGPHGMLPTLIALHVVKDEKGAEKLLLTLSTGLILMSVVIYLAGNNVFHPRPPDDIRSHVPVFGAAHTP